MKLLQRAPSIAGALALLLWTSACASPPPAIPAVDAAPPADLAYRIQPGDQLAVQFPNAPELDQQVTVRPDGRITLSLVSEVEAGGATPEELAGRVSEMHVGQLRDPAVRIRLQLSAKRVFVDGQVDKPAEVPWTRPLTVLQALSLAGGATDEAMLEGVLVIRHSAAGRQIFEIDAAQARIDSRVPDMVLEPDDIVYVPKSRVARVNQWVDQYIRKNLPVSIRTNSFF